MRHCHHHRESRILAWILLPTLMAPGLLAQNAQPPPVPQEERPEVLTRGPVHEAFAEPVPLNNQEPLSVQPAPPPLIDEQPPEERPDGNYVWVPGYWAWDQDRNDYIWVSACWRAAPPGMYWVPGYWVQNGDRWEWVSGFWAPVQDREIEYLPAPPPLEDVLPPGPSPVKGIWVSPCWYWYSGQYVLRPGYWLDAQSDWVWQPSHYVWTPRGYVFSQGYWDYALERRGILYAPVYFPRSYYSRPYPVYTPSVVVSLGLLTGFLFTYPRYNHYCFGDYYDTSYISLGIYPWFESARYTSWYDPLYRHYRWSHREDTTWEEGIRDSYTRRVRNPDQRPPRTHREWEKKSEQLSDRERRQYRLTRSWRDVVNDRERPVPTRRLDAEGRRSIVQKSGEMQRLRVDRGQWEGAGGKTAPGQPDSVRLPTDPRSRDQRPERTERVERTKEPTPSAVPEQPRSRITPPEPIPAPEPPSDAQPPTQPVRREERQRVVQPVPQPQPQPPPVIQPPAQPSPREERQRVVQPVPAPQPRPREVQPVPAPQPQSAPSVPRPRPVQPALPGPDGQSQPVRQPRVRVTQPERVPVPPSAYTQPSPAPVPQTGTEIPPEPEPEIRIRRERGRP